MSEPEGRRLFALQFLWSKLTEADDELLARERLAAQDKPELPAPVSELALAELEESGP